MSPGLVGGAGPFLKFLEAELLPMLSRNYRIDQGALGLAGHSASGAFVTKNPEIVQKIVTSLVRAAALIAKDPDKAAPHVGAALGKGIVDPELIRKALVSPASTFEIDPRKIIEPSRAMQAYQVKLGSLEKELPFDGLFETQFYERAVKASG